MAEARDFRCYSHVTDNLGERSIPSVYVAIRIEKRKPQDHCGNERTSATMDVQTYPVLCYLCGHTHVPRTTFSHARSLHSLVFTCCQSVQSHIDLHAPAWLKTRAHCSSVAHKHSYLILVAPCPTLWRS